MTHDVVPTQELLIKKNYHSVVGVSDYCATKSKWNVFSPSGVNVNDTISDIVIFNTLLRVWLAPEWVAFLIDKVWWKILKFSTLKLNSLELLFYCIFVLIKLNNQV